MAPVSACIAQSLLFHHYHLPLYRDDLLLGFALQGGLVRTCFSRVEKRELIIFIPFALDMFRTDYLTGRNPHPPRRLRALRNRLYGDSPAALLPPTVSRGHARALSRRRIHHPRHPGLLRVPIPQPQRRRSKPWYCGRILLRYLGGIRGHFPHFLELDLVTPTVDYWEEETGRLPGILVSPFRRGDECDRAKIKNFILET